jgi:hypothetical protein
VEWCEAAIWANYKPAEFFDKLDGSQQSLIVALYETHNQIEGILAMEQAKKMRHKAPKGGKG